ncbi:MAG: DUF4197 domain-containing protein [Bacteroidales bacterium]|nr:DUF4197 domain-containing protein [Bacteroidales bacterium]
MKRITIIFLLTLSIGFSSCDILQQIVDDAGGGTGLTDSEIIAGLKEALIEGTVSSVKVLNATDGYFKDNAVKILLPPEANVIVENIQKVPGIGQKTIDDLVFKINRAAEDAASEAKPIFIDAVKSMTIQDGMTILKGSNTAATNYLKSKTYNKLVSKFAPKINTSLNKKLVGNVSAGSAWTKTTSLYNKVAPIIGKPKVTTDLGAYVTKKALNGLFLKVGEEEKKIRANPYAYVSEIIKKVFGYAKKNF